MKRIDNININLSISDMQSAAYRAFRGHSSKRDVKAFKKDFDNRCMSLFLALKDGSWKERLSYRSLVKVNNNGKVRNILSPSLETRIYQHLLLNLLEPHYSRKDNLNGLNCKPTCGITSSIPSHSVIHRLKHIFYDRRDLHYCLVIDQRKCYEHITPKVFRKALKQMVADPWLVDYAVDVCFVKGKLPIGTPTSPFVHHIVMLEFDYFVKSLSSASVRYADDNFLAFATKDEAQMAKWRIKNWWWYRLGMRAKRGLSKVRPLSVPCDFCGYVFHRNQDRTVCGHDKGYVSVRKSTLRRARKCRSDKSWASYYGLMKHADNYALMRYIENKMKLSALTQKIRIDRKMDARHVEIKDLLGMSITIYDYELRYNSQREANWIKCLVGMEEVVDGERTGKILAREFHGNYQGIIQFILACEREYGKQAVLPLEEVEIENQCGYIFKNSTNQLTYIET